MAKNAEVSKEEEKVEGKVEEKEEAHGAWCFFIVTLTLVNISFLNVISFVTIQVIWSGSYAPGNIIDLANSETNVKRFKNTRFSWKNATHADLDGSPMRWDAKRDAPRPSKTPNRVEESIFSSASVKIYLHS